MDEGKEGGGVKDNERKAKTLGISVAVDGTTTIGNLSPDAPTGSKITLSEDQLKLLVKIRDARFDEGDGG